ncbi:hypothetical protein [Agromyces sp. M3QZ16-3]|uniref:hypothetical protein n=1 Tax=Agromyces sp. M3QZ16-3 TaxID=3447585 RepID=UPI003F690BE0
MLSYEQAHRSIRRARGPASSYPCLNCGDPARHWAYRNASTAELVGPVRGRAGSARYSSDVADYDPLCVLCHRIRDEQIGVEIWEWRGASEAEVEEGLLEEFRDAIEDLREVCEEDELDFDEELDYLTEEYIRRARHTLAFVRRWALMHG